MAALGARQELQEAAGSEQGHPWLRHDVQRHALVGRDEQDASPRHGDVGEGSGGGRSGVAFDDQQDAGAVNWGNSVVLHRGWHLQTGRDAPIRG